MFAETKKIKKYFQKCFCAPLFKIREKTDVPPYLVYLLISKTYMPLRYLSLKNYEKY